MRWVALALALALVVTWFVSSGHSGEDRWCAVPLDGSEVVSNWTQYPLGLRRETHSRVLNVRCHPKPF